LFAIAVAGALNRLQGGGNARLIAPHAPDAAAGRRRW
jgi:hypothetical protein